MRILIIFTLSSICLTALGQTSPEKKDTWVRIDTTISRKGKNNWQKPLTTLTSYSGLDTEIRYTNSEGKIVIIQNSGPRGGRGFTDAVGIVFGYRVYWNRIINESDAPLELTVNFPADSFALPAPDSYMKVFLLPDTLKEQDLVPPEVDSVLKSHYDAAPHSRPNLRRTINPKESYFFHIIVLRHHTAGGVPRGGFALKEQRLFYRIAPEFDAKLIPCGGITFKN